MHKVNGFRVVLFWAGLGIIIVLPIGIALTSPLLEWRSFTYKVAGLGGVIAMSLLLLQPLLASNAIPGFSLRRARVTHRWIGITLTLSVIVHVIGLWITSPPDVIDALLFVSATTFSIWGVLAMWSILIAACLVMLRRKLRISTRAWRNSHKSLAIVTVIGSVVHAMMIEGTMGIGSKTMLCTSVVAASAWALIKVSALRR